MTPLPTVAYSHHRTNLREQSNVLQWLPTHHLLESVEFFCATFFVWFSVAICNISAVQSDPSSHYANLVRFRDFTIKMKSPTLLSTLIKSPLQFSGHSEACSRSTNFDLWIPEDALLRSARWSREANLVSLSDFADTKYITDTAANFCWIISSLFRTFRSFLLSSYICFPLIVWK